MDLPPPGEGPSDLVIAPAEFNAVVSKLRAFFQGLGFVEVHTQNRLSILAACEDPHNVATFSYLGKLWPLPQTGQMWLEYEFARNPDCPGYFCVTTSYRQEPAPVKDRHLAIFPLFEFETGGGLDRLREIERQLLIHLGYDSASFQQRDYEAVCKEFGCEEVDHAAEARLGEQTPACWLERFPERTSPFWNMKRNGDGTAAKIDVILSGQETIGSAERSCDVEQMRKCFYSIEDGAYATLLFNLFTEARVKQELEEYLALPTYPRCGAGIGLSRLLFSMKRLGLLGLVSGQ